MGSEVPSQVLDVGFDQPPMISFTVSSSETEH